MIKVFSPQGSYTTLTGPNRPVYIYIFSPQPRHRRSYYYRGRYARHGGRRPSRTHWVGARFRSEPAFADTFALVVLRKETEAATGRGRCEYAARAQDDTGRWAHVGIGFMVYWSGHLSTGSSNGATSSMWT